MIHPTSYVPINNDLIKHDWGYEMKKNIAIAGAAALTLLLSACASTPSNSLAIQKADNQYEVTGIGKTALIAKNNAIEAAAKTCGSKATAIVSDEKTEYQGALKGVVSDETGKMIQAAASVLGSISGTNSGINQDSDYQTVLTFSCKAK